MPFNFAYTTEIFHSVSYGDRTSAIQLQENKTLSYRLENRASAACFRFILMLLLRISLFSVLCTFFDIASTPYTEMRRLNPRVSVKFSIISGVMKIYVN